MFVSQALKWAIRRLGKRKLHNNYLDAEVLLSFVLKKPREFLFTCPEKKLTDLQLKTYQLLIARRAKHEPVAYLTGQKEFYGLDFKVSPAVLIPRPETELIISLALDKIKRLKDYKITLVDVGTGTSCIPISIIKSSNLPIFQSFAIDISQKALKIARLNAQRHGVARRIKFLKGNLLEPFISNFVNLRISNFVITSNLPYLTTRQWQKTSPTVRLYEPRFALDGGPDGLKYFRELFRQIKISNIQYLISNILLEIDPTQTKKIKGLAKKYLPKAEIQIKKDLAGRERVMIIKN